MTQCIFCCTQAPAALQAVCEVQSVEMQQPGWIATLRKVEGIPMALQKRNGQVKLVKSCQEAWQVGTRALQNP